MRTISPSVPLSTLPVSRRLGMHRHCSLRQGRADHQPTYVVSHAVQLHQRFRLPLAVSPTVGCASAAKRDAREIRRQRKLALNQTFPSTTPPLPVVLLLSERGGGLDQQSGEEGELQWRPLPCPSASHRSTVMRVRHGNCHRQAVSTARLPGSISNHTGKQKCMRTGMDSAYRSMRSVTYMHCTRVPHVHVRRLIRTNTKSTKH